ncbi:MAG TPA: cation-translocating P-type ATPase [Polyangia bacterium]|nr:cation-translocating P-type ATPase [Polyangia bacterium]
MSTGLSSAAAAERLARFGRNELAQQRRASWPRRLLAQLESPLVLLLLGACGVSALLGERGDATAIGVIVVVNAFVGFLQEARAERALAALAGLTAPRGSVVRDGRTITVPASEVVRGDVLVLEAGDVVAADATLEAAHALSANEALLTGESALAEKAVGGSAPGTALAERHGEVFMGTSIATGAGRAVVSATGMATELGRIAHLMATVKREPTPLDRRLARVGRFLLVGCLVVVTVTAAVALLRARPALEVLMSAVSLAVAAVPEGLPAIVTIALAVGVQRMAARNVLVRKLGAVETLGSTTVICTDKTGTLTTGVMAVRDVWGRDHDDVLAAAAACCDAELGADGRGGAGDPTELAILAEAFTRGVRRETIDVAAPRVATQPFDASRRRMSVLRADGALYVKGALEAILGLCTSGADRAAAERAAAEMAARALRVLAVARGRGPEERALELVGLVGLADPPRTEAVEAVAAARVAGIRTIMITGDHPLTAQAIAREMGIAGPQDAVADVVHARATPEDKLRIVRALKAEGHVVSMTGDGVNDAPALREAHVGVAMGKTGTEVTRAAADVVLADDGFASIVAGVREGRAIFDNIRKTLVYLLAGNLGELFVMFGAAVVGLPPPLLPLHLLWINLVTDGLPALALVLERPSEDVMRRPPRPSTEPLLARAEWIEVALTGLFEGAIVLATFGWAQRRGDVAAARTLAFGTLVFCELFRAFAARSRVRVFWELGAFTNLRLLGVVVLSVAAQLALHVVGALRGTFEIARLEPGALLLALGLGLVPTTAVEISKLVRRARLRGEWRPS